MHNSHSRINDTEAWLSHSNALRLCHQTHHASLLALGSLQLFWIFGFKDMFSQYIRCKATTKCSLDCPVDGSCLEIFIIHPQPWRLSQQVALVRIDSAFLAEWLFSLLYHYDITSVASYQLQTRYSREFNHPTDHSTSLMHRLIATIFASIRKSR